MACPRPILLDPAALAELIRREHIECLELVPALAEVLASHIEGQGEGLGGIKLLAVGSDTLRGRLHRRLRQLVGPGGRVVNSYGLTEATIDSTYFGGLRGTRRRGRPGPDRPPLARDSGVRPGWVRRAGSGGFAWRVVHRGLGRGTRIRLQSATDCRAVRAGPARRARITNVRDRRSSAVVRGRQPRAARGATTARSRCGASGSSSPRSRPCSRAAPGVSAAAVESRPDTAGNQRLVGYIVPLAATEHQVSELRRWLQVELPEYMVPSAFVVLEALPLSRNGKIDRKALPTPGPGQLDPVVEYVAPRDPLEETLVAVWAEVLELERVGVHDDFFDLGGHSLQSLQLVARLTAALNRPVSVKAVFQAPTAAAMANLLERDAAGVGSLDPSHPSDDDRAASAAWLLEQGPAKLPEHVTIERRPFSSLFATGEFARSSRSPWDICRPLSSLLRASTG